MRIETLYLEVTRMCTLECEHCVRGDRENKFMSSETINNALKDVKEIGLLFFEGGEPLLAIDQILETIEIIKTRGGMKNIRNILICDTSNKKIYITIWEPHCNNERIKFEKGEIISIKYFISS